MVMEYVEGESIESLLRRGSLGLHESISCTVQVLDALAYAHAHGVVHRDIKPANIMRTSAGVAKLMDFGIARVEADRRLTQTGHAVGSLFYMSPEQIKGAQPDARSDIYSLGITLYEMVTGRRPFEGDSDFSIMAAHLEQAPMAPIEVVPGVPGEVNDIILMAIAKDPTARFQTAAAFQAALKSLDQPQGGTVVRSSAPQPAPPPRVAPVLPPTLVNPLPPTLPRQPLPQQALPPQQAFAPPPVPPPPSFQQQPPSYQQAAPYGQPFPQRPMGGGAMPVPPAKSRRGLYMAVGSIATLLVLGAAIVEGPKLLRTGASNAAQQDVPGAAQTPPTATPVQPTTPADTPAAQTNPITPEPAPAPPVQTTPVQPPPPEPVKPARTTPPAVRQAPPTPVAAQPAPVQPPVQQAPPPVQAQTPPPPPPGPSAQQMNEIRKDYNLLAIRVGSTKSGLRSIEQQMRRQGLDLRGDVLEAESRMDYQMKEAQDSLRAGDIGAARSEMQMAERALETLEKFLGH
jgi:serine/threonine-protein kinase